MLHKFDTRYPEQCVAIAVNVSDCMLCTRGRFNCKNSYAKDMDIVDTVHNGDMVDTKREMLENSSQEITLDSNKENCHINTKKLTPIPENLAVMFHRDFYLKPRITLLDAELSAKTQWQLETIGRIFQYNV